MTQINVDVAGLRIGISVLDGKVVDGVSSAYFVCPVDLLGIAVVLVHDDGERIVGRVVVRCVWSPDDNGVGVGPGTFCEEGSGDVIVAAKRAHTHLVVRLRLQAREHPGFAGGAGDGDRPSCITDGLVGDLVGVRYRGVPLLPRHERGTARNLNDLKVSRTAGVQPCECERGLRDKVLACAVGDIRPAAVTVVVAQAPIGGIDAVKIGGPVDTRGGCGKFQQQIAAVIYKRIVKVDCQGVTGRHCHRASVVCGKIRGGMEISVVKLILIDNSEFCLKNAGPWGDGRRLQVEGDGGNFSSLHVVEHRGRINHLISQKVVGITRVNGRIAVRLRAVGHGVRVLRLNRHFNAGEHLLVPFAHKRDETEILQHGVDGVGGAQLLGNHIFVSPLHQSAL